MSEDKKSINNKTDDSIDFKESIRQKLPADFNVNEIGNIDLIEAEKIANEDIVFLSEDDLIVELEDIELFPVNNEEDTKKIEPDEKHKKQGKTNEKSVQEIPLHEDKEEFQSFAEKRLDDQAVQTKPVDEAEVPPLDDVAEKNIEADQNSVKIESHDDVVHFEIHEEFSDTEDAVIEPAPSERTKHVEEKKEAPVSFETTGNAEYLQIDEYIKSHIDIKDGYEYEEIQELQEIVSEPVSEIHKEQLPHHLLSQLETQNNVYFADDRYVISGGNYDEIIFEENELEKITSDIVEVIEGKAKVLYEAEPETDKEMVAHGLTGIAPVFEDLLLDFEDEYKYTDDEIDFIHSVITEEDYSDYIRYIDEYHGIKIKKGITNAVELLGLTPVEVDAVQGKMFQEEYKDVNFNEIFEFFQTDYSSAGRDQLIEKNCTYIIPGERSLTNSDRKSIESDLTAGSALIYEEDVDVIRDLFVKAVGAEKAEKIKVVDEIHDITDQVVIIEDEIDVDRFVMEFPENKQDEIKKLLTYLDGLFEKLPRDTLKIFVDSEYFDLYVKVLTDMGV